MRERARCRVQHSQNDKTVSRTRVVFFIHVDVKMKVVVSVARTTSSSPPPLLRGHNSTSRFWHPRNVLPFISHLESANAVDSITTLLLCILLPLRLSSAAPPVTMPRARTFRLAALVLANVLLPVAVLIFASGFFPYKPFLPGLAVWEDVAEPGEKIAGDGRAGGEGGGGYTALAKQPEPAFDRVVFMVVDALRSDFVFGHGSGFEFVQRYALRHWAGSRRSGWRRRGGSWLRVLTMEQSDTRRRRHPLHRPRDAAHRHHAPSQSSHDRLRPVLPRPHPQLRRVRHFLLPRDAGYVAGATPRGAERQTRLLRRRHLAETLPTRALFNRGRHGRNRRRAGRRGALLAAPRRHQQLFRLGQ